MSANRAIRLLVVDDHTLFRRGLTALLGAQPGLEVAGEAADAGEALRRAAALQPDVILLDHHLPGVNGVDVLENLLQAAPAAKVLMLTISEEGDTLAEALRLGAHGYLLKTVDSEMLVAAIEKVMIGEATISPEMAGKLVTAFQALHAERGAGRGASEGAPSRSPRLPEQLAPKAVAVPVPEPAAPVAPDPLALLSPREHEILREIANGASNKEIARTLAIAETTVKIHVQHILRKLNLSSRVQAAVLLAGRDGVGA